MFKVEVTYKTQFGNLRVNMTTSQRVQKRHEAEEVRAALLSFPELANATITVKNAPPDTVDEAMEGFRRSFAEYPPNPQTGA